MDKARLQELAGLPITEGKEEVKEGAMMDDGRKYIFAQEEDWDYGKAMTINIRADDEDEAHNKLNQIIGEAENLGIEFGEDSWQLVSSY